MDMNITVSLDVSEQVLYDNIVKFLPSISAEIRAEKAKELGQEPLCRDNVNERIFRLGVRGFLNQFEESGGNVYSGVVKNKVLESYTRVSRTLVDMHTGFQAKMNGAKEKYEKALAAAQKAEEELTAATSEGHGETVVTARIRRGMAAAGIARLDAKLKFMIADGQYSAICMAIALVDRDFLGNDDSAPGGKPSEKPRQEQPKTTLPGSDIATRTGDGCRGSGAAGKKTKKKASKKKRRKSK